MGKLNAACCPARSLHIFGLTVWPRGHDLRMTGISYPSHYLRITCVNLKCAFCHFRECRVMDSSEVHHYGIPQPYPLVYNRPRAEPESIKRTAGFPVPLFLRSRDQVTGGS